MTDDSKARTDIQQILEEIAPETVLVFDPAGSNWFEPIQRAHPDWSVTYLTRKDGLVEQVESAGRHDAAVLADTLEYLDHNRAEILLSRLRDLYSRHILALVPTGRHTEKHLSHWKDADLVALGLNPLTGYDNGQHLYEFNILSYKSVPDWLNARDWANPELWDKYRW